MQPTTYENRAWISIIWFRSWYVKYYNLAYATTGIIIYECYAHDDFTTHIFSALQRYSNAKRMSFFAAGHKLLNKQS